LVVGAALIAQPVCGYWRIENGLHRVLENTFRESRYRLCRSHTARNIMVLRCVALHILPVLQLL
jgi:predicted transposase YbfD/YdcC